MTLFSKARSDSRAKRNATGARQEPRLSRESAELIRSDVMDFEFQNQLASRNENDGLSRIRPVRVRPVTAPQEEAELQEHTIDNGSGHSDWTEAPHVLEQEARYHDRPIAPRRIWDMEPEEERQEDSMESAQDHPGGREMFSGWNQGEESLAEHAPATGRSSWDASIGADDEDLEDEPAASEAQSQEDKDIEYARAQLSRLDAMGYSATEPAAEDTRARTRVLGFGNPAANAADPFAREANDPDAQGDTAFAVGWLVIVDGPGKGRSFVLTHGVATIGRAEDQTVRLDFGDNAISRVAHASVVYDEEANCYYLGAGTKSNIVRRNGRPVLATEEMNDGDQIRIGETTLRFVALCSETFSWASSPSEAVRHG